MQHREALQQQLRSTSSTHGHLRSTPRYNGVQEARASPIEGRRYDRIPIEDAMRADNTTQPSASAITMHLHDRIEARRSRDRSPRAIRSREAF